jgi:hypothetical protein
MKSLEHSILHALRRIENLLTELVRGKNKNRRTWTIIIHPLEAIPKEK